MAKKNSNSIHLEHRSKLYKFINVSIEDTNDGSVYINLVRDGKTSQIARKCNDGFEVINLDVQPNKKKRLSYHASGQVNYHDLPYEPHYFEPVSAVTEINHIATWSIPQVCMLDEAEQVKEKDQVVNLDLGDSRVVFHIVVAPNNFFPIEKHVSIRYEGLLSVFVILDDTPEAVFMDVHERGFLVFPPPQTKFNRVQLSQEDALIKYHQKVKKTNGLIMYSPNGEGVYKIITAVVMRQPPRVIIEFDSDEYKIEILSRKEHMITFKVKNNHGAYIKTAVPIRMLMLDAEIY